MTDKMELMFEDIMCALFNCIPIEHVDFCFEECYPIHPIIYGDYIMLEFVKYAYYESLEKHPLRYYFPYSSSDDDHSERMRYARAFKYTQKYKDINYEMLGDSVGWDADKVEEFNELKGKDMSDMANRTEGYELTEMDVFEHTNVQELRIIKSIVEQRIYSSKKVSNELFIELFEEYDEWVEKLIERSQKSEEDLLFAAMAYFTLEWKYSLEYIYLVADYMEQNNINEVDYRTLWAMTLPLTFDSRLGVSMHEENRMIKERQFLIPDFIKEGVADLTTEFYRTKYVEIVGITAIFNNMTSTEGGLYRDWFKDNTNIEDWASFIEEYEIFDTWHKKEWTNKKIKNARKILEMLSPFKNINTKK